MIDGTDPKFSFNAGAYIAYSIGGKSTVEVKSVGKEKDDLISDEFAKRFDFGVGFGAGVEFGQINVGLGYDFGLANINQGDEKIRNMNGYLSLGYKF